MARRRDPAPPQVDAVPPGVSGAGDKNSVPALPGTVQQATLANGLTVCLLSLRSAPVVTCALFYRAGSRDEAPEQAGIAHFLEHMMFKGSPGYGPGEIDRRTQALGGSNNAFTSHDLTAYHFDFAPDRWQEALAVEADRMAALTLDPVEVERERRVILEELAASQADPWDALGTAVDAAFFGRHPYGRHVLGGRRSLKAIGAAELAAFHRRFYTPANAVLAVVGDVGEEALAAAERTLGRLPAAAAGSPGGAGARPAIPPASSLTAPSLTAPVRITRRAGEVPRLLLALPAPAADHPELPGLGLLLLVLSGGRASRLERRLVDEAQLASWIACDLHSSVDPGYLGIAAELPPGVEPERFEEALRAELGRLASEPPTAEEVERARQIARADWVFGHERVHTRALTVGAATILFDPDRPRRHLERLLATPASALPELAARYLDPEKGCVIGWGLPAAERP